VYGPIAADHLNQPRNLGRIEQPDAVGHVEEQSTDTQVTVYLQLSTGSDGQRTVTGARYRAFGCGGCIIAGSAATELVMGQPLAAAARVDAAAILRALDDGLPAHQRYCADLVAQALQQALAAVRS
jgi:nitrogen fixation NifU-like protein